MVEQNALATTHHYEVSARPSIFLDMQRFADAQRVATLLAASDLVPKHFQGKPANCVIALNLADRLMVDPFMLMQSMYVVHGRPGIEGKLAIALVEGTGRFSPLKFKFAGSGKTEKSIPRADSCIAYATEVKTGEVIEGPPVTWEMAVAEGWTKPKGEGVLSKWQTLPDLMFRYRAAMFFARVNCPGALLGLRSTDEIEDVEMVQQENGTFTAPTGQEGAAETTGDETTNGDGDEAFTATIPTGTDLAVLDTFLVMVAKANKMTVSRAKEEAAKNAAGFWKTYVAWQAQEAKKKEREASKNGNGGNGQTKTEPPDDPTCPNACPNDADSGKETFYMRSHCAAKTCWEGCPAWKAEGAKV